MRLLGGCERSLQYRGDPQRVDQILVNLASNALKFSARGAEVVLRCSTCEGSLPDGGPWGSWTLIEVEDHGIGIPPEDASRIFEPFVQVETGYTRRHGGAGLGLAISLRLARSMGGSLSLRSEVGSGSTFTLWLQSAPEA